MIRVIPRLLAPQSDPWLWLAAAAIVVLGVFMVNSATLAAAQPSRLSEEAFWHIAYAVSGIVAMLIVLRLDYRLLYQYAAYAYAAVLIPLGAVLAIGVAEHGAQRWLGIGSITVQPGEFAKLALAVALAAYGSTRVPSGRTLLMSGLLAGLPAGLVLLQPDLGTVVVLAGIWLVFAVGWGVPWRVLAALAVMVAAAGPLAFAVAVPAYQRERLAVFLDPGRDPLGSGFNLRQVEVALGTGGLTGHGLHSGAESHLDSVAARSSDFMFGFLGAELGLIGGLLLLALFAVVITRGLDAAQHAPDAFGRLLALTLTSIILVQVLVNVAVNLRLFPATGIPLPLASQGGSSLVALLIAIGIIQAVSARRPAAPAEQWQNIRERGSSAINETHEGLRVTR